MYENTSPRHARRLLRVPCSRILAAALPMIQYHAHRARHVLSIAAPNRSRCRARPTPIPPLARPGVHGRSFPLGSSAQESSTLMHLVRGGAAQPQPRVPASYRDRTRPGRVSTLVARRSAHRTTRERLGRCQTSQVR
ncbi:hypothetical protein EXIGLDRAFT_145312 [Exidia glandulosa HHB12029]|uniref:Uncharacterized protein n=1 Tax=Exidia glandulosa HHB12029 TaxID=1314781 RepID=A0A165ND40_EXIGL|nr:hypothetical protein EXIGLDRAFT_145312 [Exidia glandulosa HHB12029]